MSHLRIVNSQTCESCRFWQEIPDAIDRDAGLCRVDPPTMAGDSVIGEWPQTAPEDWCGRHEPRDTHPLRVHGRRR